MNAVCEHINNTLYLIRANFHQLPVDIYRYCRIFENILLFIVSIMLMLPYFKHLKFILYGWFLESLIFQRERDSKRHVIINSGS